MDDDEDGSCCCSDGADAGDSIAEDTMSAQDKNDMGHRLPPGVRKYEPPPPRQFHAFYAEEDSVGSFDREEIRLGRLNGGGGGGEQEDFDEFDDFHNFHEDDVEGAREQFMELCSRVAWNDTTLTEFDACGREDYSHACNNEDLVLLGESLDRNTNLKSLTLVMDEGRCTCRRDSLMEQQGAIALRQGLAKCRLATLKLRRLCCDEFQRLLFQEPAPCALQVLDYYGRNQHMRYMLEPPPPPPPAALAATVLPTLIPQVYSYPKLQELRLGGCTVDSEDMLALSRYLAQHPTLTSLRLENFRHRPYASSATMWLSPSEEAPIAAAHACILADGLRQNTSLTSLSVSSNQVGARGAQLLLQAAAVHPSLQTFSLTRDDTIDFAGLLLIAREVPHTKLKRVVLDGAVYSWPLPQTELAHQTGQALLQAVQNSLHLTQFSLTQLDSMWMEPIRYRLALNETCGPLLTSEVISPAVWPHIFARWYGPDKMGHVYFSLKEQPLLIRRFEQ